MSKGAARLLQRCSGCGKWCAPKLGFAMSGLFLFVARHTHGCQPSPPPPPARDPAQCTEQAASKHRTPRPCRACRRCCTARRPASTCACTRRPSRSSSSHPSRCPPATRCTWQPTGGRSCSWCSGAAAPRRLTGAQVSPGLLGPRLGGPRAAASCVWGASAHARPAAQPEHRSGIPHARL